MADSKLDLPVDLVPPRPAVAKVDPTGGNEEMKGILGSGVDPKDQAASENNIPLSPQWLHAKPSESKTWFSAASGEKKEWRRNLPDSESSRRWHEEERETGLLGRRERRKEGDKENDQRKNERRPDNISTRETADSRALFSSDRRHEVSSHIAGHENRRGSKWSSRWGPEDKEKNSRPEKKIDVDKVDTVIEKQTLGRNRPVPDSDSRDKWRPRHRQDAFSGGSSVHHAAPGFGSERLRGESTNVGFAPGRGRSNVIGSFALSRFSTASPIGATLTDKTELHGKSGLSSQSFRYPRGKLLDIYRMQNASLLIDTACVGFKDIPSITGSSSFAPMAFVTPDAEEKALLDDIWKGEALSSEVGLESSGGNLCRFDDLETERVSSGGVIAFGTASTVAKDGSQCNIEVRSCNHPASVQVVGQTSPRNADKCNGNPFPNNTKFEEDNLESYIDGSCKLPCDSDSLFDMGSVLETPKAICEYRNNHSEMKQSEQVISPEELSLLYRDPQGEIQGPFLGVDIISWFEQGFFDVDLLVCSSDAPEGTPFKELGEVMPFLKLKSQNFPITDIRDSPEPLDNLEDSILCAGVTSSVVVNGQQLTSVNLEEHHIQPRTSKLDNLINPQCEKLPLSTLESSVSIVNAEEDNFHEDPGHEFEEVLYSGRPLSRLADPPGKLAEHLHDLSRSPSEHYLQGKDLGEHVLANHEALSSSDLHPFGLLWSELEETYPKQPLSLNLSSTRDGGSTLYPAAEVDSNIHDHLQESLSSARDLPSLDAWSSEYASSDIRALHATNQFSLEEHLLNQELQKRQLHQQELCMNGLLLEQGSLRLQQSNTQYGPDVENLLKLQYRQQDVQQLYDQQQHIRQMQQQQDLHEQRHYLQATQRLCQQREQEQQKLRLDQLLRQQQLHDSGLGQQREQEQKQQYLDQQQQLRLDQQRQLRLDQLLLQQQLRDNSLLRQREQEQQQLRLEQRQQLRLDQQHQLWLDQLLLQQQLRDNMLIRQREQEQQQLHLDQQQQLCLDQLLLQQQLRDPRLGSSCVDPLMEQNKLQALSMQRLMHEMQQQSGLVQQQDPSIELLHGKLGHNFHHERILSSLSKQEQLQARQIPSGLRHQMDVDDDRQRGLWSIDESGQFVRAAAHPNHFQSGRPSQIDFLRHQSPSFEQPRHLERSLLLQEGIPRELYEPNTEAFERPIPFSASNHRSNSEIADFLPEIQGINMHALHDATHHYGRMGQFLSGVSSPQCRIPKQNASSHINPIEESWGDGNRRMPNYLIEPQFNQLHLSGSQQERGMNFDHHFDEVNSKMSLSSNDEISRQGVVNLLQQNLDLSSSSATAAPVPLNSIKDASWPLSVPFADRACNLHEDEMDVGHPIAELPHLHRIRQTSHGQLMNAALERTDSHENYGSFNFHSKSVPRDAHQRFLSAANEIQRKLGADHTVADAYQENINYDPWDGIRGKKHDTDSKIKVISRSGLEIDAQETGVEQENSLHRTCGELKVNVPMGHASLSSSGGNLGFSNYGAGVDSAFCEDMINGRISGITLKEGGDPFVNPLENPHILPSSSAVAELAGHLSTRERGLSKYASYEDVRQETIQPPAHVPETPEISKKELRFRRTTSQSDADVPSEATFVDMLKSTKKPTTPDADASAAAAPDPKDGGPSGRGGKKKAKKGRQIDPSLLGFKVHSNRILMGEIQRPDD